MSVVALTRCAPRRLSLAALLLASASAWAGAPSSAAILRVDTGNHTQLVRALAYDITRDRLVSASLDRTVRVWTLPELRLVNALRVPMEVLREGELTNVQVSPDGRIIATGGWTGWNWDRQGCVYLFDAQTGDLLKRLDGFDSIIGDLRFSPDGRTLAVGLHGGAGLAFVDMADLSVRAHDRDYRERVIEVNFAPHGLIAAVALDGYLRIYGPDFELLARHALPSSKRLAAVKFAPDGTRLAVGFFDLPEIAILALPGLDSIAKLSVPDDSLISLSTLAWSTDGQYLFAAGDHRGRGPQPIYRWSRAGDPVPLVTVRGRIAQITVLPGDRIAYATEEPAIGLIDSSGRRLATSAGDALDFRDGLDLHVSGDGKAVELIARGSGGERLRFSVPDLELRSAPGAQETRSDPAVEAARIGLTDWKDGEHPRLAGAALELDAYELSRSFAVSPDRSRVFLGAEWWLRAFSSTGRRLAQVETPGPVWALATDAQGRYVIAALGDGTVRWYRASDLRETLALFVHRNGSDWVLWRPDGYYASSEKGDNYVGWHLNRGKDTTPDFFRAVQFEQLFYRPDLLRGGPDWTAGTAASGPGADRELLARIAPPRVRVLHVEDADSGLTRVRYEAERTGAPMRSTIVYLNGIPLTPHAQRALARSEQSRFSRTLDLRLDRPDNLLRIEIDTGASLGVREVYLPGDDAARERARGDLHVLAIGVDRLPGAGRERFPDLPFAARDARELAKVLSEQSGLRYRAVHVTVLSGAQADAPTRRKVLEALEQFKAAGPDDTSLLFISAHGVSDARGNYYMLPRDAQARDVLAVLNGKNTSGQAGSLIGWRTLFEALRSAAGMRLLIVDTCHARTAAGTFDARSLKKRSAASQFPLLLSSDSKELAQDYPKGGHGLFTYALLRGLRGEADLDRDAAVSLAELSAYIAPLVTTLQDKRLGKQTPQFVVPEELGASRLVRLAPPQPQQQASGLQGGADSPAISGVSQ